MRGTYDNSRHDVSTKVVHSKCKQSGYTVVQQNLPMVL